MKKILLILVTLISATIAFASVKIGGIYYNLNDETKTAEVTYQYEWSSNNYSGVTSITIPKKVTYNTTEYSVTSIGEKAFYDCTSLTSITIPNSVNSIGERAFSYCSSLTSITIPNSVTSIGYNAFSGCRSLTSITIPNSVTSIGNSAFSSCSSLTSISIPNSVTSIGEDAFWYCSSLTSVTIPNSVTSIGEDAFFGTPWLNNQPDGCLYIGKLLYMYKGKMPANTHIDIKEGTTIICGGAFSNCSYLTSITIPNSVTSIGEGAFDGCSSLTSIQWNAKKYKNFSSSENSPFYNIREQITSFTFGDSVEHIPAYFFYGMNNLTSVTIPNGVISIGRCAFCNCTSLTSITIGNSVTSIREYAFSDCTSLTSITIPNSVTSIGYNAFDGCSSLSSITIGNSVTSIGHNAFDGCSSLSSIQWNTKKYNDFSSVSTNPFYEIKKQIKSFAFGDSVEHIPANLCYGMNKLTFITIENNVTSIGNNTFSNCSSLTSITIGNSVTSIGYGAFYNCESLTSITIPNSVTSIGYNAFDGCSSLTSIDVETNNQTYASFEGVLYSKDMETLIYCPKGKTSITIGNSVTSIREDAFDDCDALTSIQWNAKKCNNFSSAENTPFYNIREQITSFAFGDSVKLIPSYLCYGINNLISVTIPNSVTSIRSWAFSDCSSLTSITIPNSVISIGYGAFYNCESLTSITIPNSVTSIRNTTFSGCSSLTSITIPDNITSIGEGAFYNCSALSASIEIPIVEMIGDNAFYNCQSLSAITIGNKLNSINENTFTNCSNLRTIKLGNSIESIGKNAFKGCTALYSFEISTEIPPIIDATTFSDVSSTLQIKVPCNSVEDYKASLYWNSFSNFKENPYSLIVNTNDETMGKAFIVKQHSCQDITAQIMAQALPGYEFVKWSDGFTENPHTIYVTNNTTITAEFRVTTTPTPIENTSDNQTNIYTTNGTLHFEGLVTDYQIYNISGQLVYTGNETSLQLPRGIYLITINGEVEKIVL